MPTLGPQRCEASHISKSTSIFFKIVCWVLITLNAYFYLLNIEVCDILAFNNQFKAFNRYLFELIRLSLVLHQFLLENKKISLNFFN